MHPRNIIAELLPLQDAFNRKVNPAWVSAGFAWHRAIWMECGELVEGTQSWKWWKAHGTPSIQQLQLEVVDIFHFLLSWGIEEGSRLANPEHAINTLSGALEARTFPGTPSPIPNLILSAESVAAAASSRNYLATCLAFSTLLRDAGLDPHSMRRMYIGKNALNTVRNANGYLSGGYQKIWRDEEDNVHLERLMHANPKLGFDDIIGALSSLYREIRA